MIPLIAMIAAFYGPEPAGRVAETADLRGFAGMVLLAEAGKVTLEKGFGTRVQQRMVRAHTPSDYLASDLWPVGKANVTLRALWQRGDAGTAARITLRGCSAPDRVIVRRDTRGGAVVLHYRLPDRKIALLLATTRRDMDPGDISTHAGLGYEILSAAACKGIED